jgi:hypothetical protein
MNAIMPQRSYRTTRRVTDVLAGSLCVEMPCASPMIEMLAA